MPVQMKRAYEDPEPSDGKRYLVDRLWPRGVKREALEIDDWLKELAPSTELRRWFNHDPRLWDEFQGRYADELENDDARALLDRLAAESSSATVTLVFGAKDEAHSNAAFLKRLIEGRQTTSRKH